MYIPDEHTPTVEEANKHLSDFTDVMKNKMVESGIQGIISLTAPYARTVATRGIVNISRSETTNTISSEAFEKLLQMTLSTIANDTVSFIVARDDVLKTKDLSELVQKLEKTKTTIIDAFVANITNVVTDRIDAIAFGMVHKRANLNGDKT